MQIVNLTPHTLNMVTGDVGTDIPSSGLARVTPSPDMDLGTIEVNRVSIPLYATSMSGAVTGLPEPHDGVMFVVSRQVYDACPNRTDLLITHQAIRDGGRIIGCAAFAQPIR